MDNLDKENAKSSHRNYGRRKFEDRYKRMTIYIEQDLYEQIQYRREQGIITNLTEFVNKALISYLTRA